MNKRIKSGLAVTEAHIKLCDDNLSRAKADSRNEFVEKAIEFYAGYLNAEQNPNFFDEMFTSAAQLKMEQVGRSLGTGQFKMSVELSKLCHLLATQMKVTDEQLQKLHKICTEEVKALGSVPTFEQAYSFQHNSDHH